MERDQAFLFPPDMRDWLPADHPVHLVIRVVEGHLDTSAFHALRRTGGAGAAGYDPDMLVTVLVWAYANQVTSSRRIEQLCGTDVAFRLICAGNLPDHATIARFRAGFPGPVTQFFAQVLALCAAVGMGRLGVVALDGTKITASASKSANRTEDSLRKMAEQAVARHGETDAAEDALFGAGLRGDEVPEDAWRPGRVMSGSRPRWPPARERETAQAERDRARQEYLAQAAACARVGKPPAGAEVEAARIALERAITAQQAKIDDWQARNAESLATDPHFAAWLPAGAGQPVRAGPPGTSPAGAGRRAGGRGRGRCRAEGEGAQRPGPVRNITDPDSRLMPVRGGGFIQGYNAQVVTSADGLIIATRLTGTTGDTTWFTPMMAAAQTPPRSSPPPAIITAAAAAMVMTTMLAAAAPAAAGTAAPMTPAATPRLSGCSWPMPGTAPKTTSPHSGPDRLIATGKLRDLVKAARGDPAARQPGRKGHPRHGRPAADSRRHRRLPLPRPHRRDPQRQHQAQQEVPPVQHARKPKASGESEFITATTNLFKAISSGHLTHAALTPWPAGPAGLPARHPSQPDQPAHRSPRPAKITSQQTGTWHPPSTPKPTRILRQPA